MISGTENQIVNAIESAEEIRDPPIAETGPTRRADPSAAAAREDRAAAPGGAGPKAAAADRGLQP